MTRPADLADDGLSPHASYEQAETVRLAFLACVQLLPARQRAIFLLHEVLGWSIAEVASAFAMSRRSAIAAYACMADDDAWRPHSVNVLKLSEGAVASIVSFVGPLPRRCFPTWVCRSGPLIRYPGVFKRRRTEAAAAINGP